MCNRHDKRVLGGAMMVGSSDLETISSVCLTWSYFCPRAPWGFLCRGPLGLPHPSEPRVIWPGAFLELVQPDGWGGGAWGIALCNKVHVASAWSLCRSVNASRAIPFSPRGDVLKFQESVICSGGLRAR